MVGKLKALEYIYTHKFMHHIYTVSTKKTFSINNKFLAIDWKLEF